MSARVYPCSCAKNGSDVMVGINSKKLQQFDPVSVLAFLN